MDLEEESTGSSSNDISLFEKPTSQTQINLFPERRRQNGSRRTQAQQKPEVTDTSRYFTPSDTQTTRTTVETEMDADDNDEDVDDDFDWPPTQELSTDRDEDDEADKEPVLPKPKRKRQMKLDFSNGTLTTKKPFTNPIRRDDSRRVALRDVAAETILLLPGLLATRPDVVRDGFLCQGESLDQKFNPKHSPVTIRVLNSDTIDAALALQNSSSNQRNKPVAILNLANANTPGGGWKYGALAQEESLCYRSSLSVTLKRRHYPIPEDAAIYSPTVMVIRRNMQKGHGLLDFRDPRKLQVLSVVTCAAVCRPPIKKDATGMLNYVLQADKRLMKEKMRVILRTAIRNRHRQLILGALGCGAFGNPNVEVAKMWKQVLQEPDFQGGWWEDVVFAVMGTGKPGDNFRVFFDELDGVLLR